MIYRVNSLEYIVYAVLYAPLLWLIIFMLGADVLHSNGMNEKTAEYGGQLQGEQRKQIETLNKRILMFDRQIALYKSGDEANDRTTGSN